MAKMLADVYIYTGIQIAAIVGGMSKQKQERMLKKQPEIIVATPAVVGVDSRRRETFDEFGAVDVFDSRRGG